jgi:hypothetical protein
MIQASLHNSKWLDWPLHPIDSQAAAACGRLEAELRAVQADLQRQTAEQQRRLESTAEATAAHIERCVPCIKDSSESESG